jgi:hypothetical protein
MTVLELLIIVYILSLTVTLIAHIRDNIDSIKSDISRCRDTWYSPRVTIGSLLRDLLVIICPIVNTVAAIIYLLMFMEWTWNSFFPNLFRIPLIPPKTKT